MPLCDTQPMADIAKVSLRLPPDIHNLLKTLAHKDRRSLNDEIIHLIEREADQRSISAAEPSTVQ